MAQYKTVFHTLAKILPRHEIDRLDRKYGQGDKRRKTSRYVCESLACAVLKSCGTAVMHTLINYVHNNNALRVLMYRNANLSVATH